MAALCKVPAPTLVQLLLPICTGLDLDTTVPSPNWPLEPNPQVNNNPSLRMATVCDPPVLTCVQLFVPVRKSPT